MSYIEDDLNEQPVQEFLPDEHDLKKEIARLRKELKALETDSKKELKSVEAIYTARMANQQLLHEKSAGSMTEQIRQLIEKNIELGEACKVFAKGIENLKRNETVVTDTIMWERKGDRTLAVRIKELTLDKKRITSIVPLQTNHRGETTHALIVTEHTERFKTPTQ